MTFPMTAVAERDQIAHHVAAQLAPRFHVMDLQVFHGAAFLAPPTISFQHLVSDHGVFFRVQFESRLPLA